MGKVRHFGLIPDGGRRWAMRQGVTLSESYRNSFETIGAFAQEFYQIGGEALSVYLLSKANLARKREELEAVGAAEVGFLEDSVHSLMRDFSVRICVAGRIELLPSPLKAAVEKMLRSSPKGERTLFLCLAYDPFDEILAAFQKLGDTAKSKAALLSTLWVNKELDLVVRTGGAVTLSNFLPLQAAYARIVFLGELFNDVTAEGLIRIIKDHEELNLRFGT